jgi:hypothetical protein
MFVHYRTLLQLIQIPSQAILVHRDDHSLIIIIFVIIMRILVRKQHFRFVFDRYLVKISVALSALLCSPSFIQSLNTYEYLGIISHLEIGYGQRLQNHYLCIIHSNICSYRILMKYQ